MPYFAHSENAAGKKHDLVQHLQAVATQAAKFAGKFGAADFGYWAGLWHDLGKFHPDFQSYIASPEAHRGPDHSSAGAVHAVAGFEGLAFLVAGHHAGLPSRTDLKLRVREKSDMPQIRTALELGRQALPQITPEYPLTQRLPDFLLTKPSRVTESKHLSRRTELFLRMVFSALVDADFLDTEAHFDKERSVKRTGAPLLEELWRRFVSDQTSISGRRGDQLNQIRHEIYLSCLKAADAEQGISILGEADIIILGLHVKEGLSHRPSRITALPSGKYPHLPGQAA